MTKTEIAIVAALIAMLALVVLGMERNAAEFERACSDIGGKAVYNGRHYECLGDKNRPPKEQG